MSRRLEAEVWDLDRCAGCGLCVAICSKGMLHWGPDGQHPWREVRQKRIGLTEIPLDTCTFCQVFCEEACARLRELEELPIRKMVSAKAESPIDSGEPLDVVKALLIANLSAGAMDGVVGSDVDGWALEPVAKVWTSVGELADCLGMQGLWVPTLDVLNEAVYERKLGNVAVFGTPCVGQAIRALKASDNGRLDPYKDALRLSVAAFCTGAYDPGRVRRYVEERMGIPSLAVKRICASPRDKELKVTQWDGSERRTPLSEIEGYTRSGCAVCDDLLGESADIAIGKIGAREGYSTLIVRSEVGEQCLQTAVDLGLVDTVAAVDQSELEAAKEDKQCRERAQAFDDLMLLMLDALREPQKRLEVREELVRLYEVDGVAQSVQEGPSHGACSQCSGC